jgi:hypothetical protein
MRTSKAFIAAIPLALVLVAAVMVLLVVAPGTFGFNSWPQAPHAAPHENVVVVDTPVEGEAPVRADRRAVDRVRRALPAPVSTQSRRVAAAPGPAPGPVRNPSPSAASGSPQDVKVPPPAPAVPAAPGGVAVVGAGDVPLLRADPVKPADAVKRPVPADGTN